MKKISIKLFDFVMIENDFKKNCLTFFIKSDMQRNIKITTYRLK